MGSGASHERGLLRPHPLVETNYGPVEGKRILLPGGHTVANVFLGIPYAKPPIGELRFKKSEPPDSWTKVKRTRSYKPRAVQFNTPWDFVDVGGVPVAEDCLYLNIVAPAHKNPKFPSGYAVMVYLHGGGFVMDSAAKYNYRDLARCLVRHDVIVVTVEYRLGYLGFLCLDEKDAKGNYGLWDQVMALRFVKENISRFGGDPDRITVFGQSAGGVSASLLAISPVSRDLFSQVICMSGFAVSMWAVNERKFAISKCRKKALKLGFRRENPKTEEWTAEETAECIKFLKKLPASKFGTTMLGDRSIVMDMRLPLTPVVDDELLPPPFRRLLETAPGKVHMAGVTLHEGLIFLPLGFRRPNASFLRYILKTVSERANEIAVDRGISSPISPETLTNIYGINDLLLQDRKAVQMTAVTMMSDLVSNVSLHNHCVRITEQEGICYRYVFDHSNWFITSLFNAYLPFVGATHATEIPYVFNVNIFLSLWYKTKADRKVCDMMGSLFTNFAKYGNPNGDPRSLERTFNFKWEPTTFQHPERHLVIRAEPQMKDQLDNRRIERLSSFLDFAIHQ